MLQGKVIEDGHGRVYVWYLVSAPGASAQRLHRWIEPVWIGAELLVSLPPIGQSRMALDVLKRGILNSFPFFLSQKLNKPFALPAVVDTSGDDHPANIFGKHGEYLS
jgi:hypothetical protein